MKHSMIKPVLAAALAAVMFFGNVTTGYAYSNTDEVNSVGWSELEEPNSLKKIEKLRGAYAETLNTDDDEPWLLRSTKSYEFSNGIITLKSYTMELLNNTKLCKAETSHSNYMYGYAEARFESIFGVEVPGSSSGRIYSYYGSKAETPTNPDYVGWTNIAHTYCGV